MRFLIPFLFYCLAQAAPLQYGEKFHLKKGESAALPDFTLAYTGDHKEPVPEYSQGAFAFRDFTATGKKETVKITWNGGTGDATPAMFKYDGREFWMDVGSSPLFGSTQNEAGAYWVYPIDDIEFAAHHPALYFYRYRKLSPMASLKTAGFGALKAKKTMASNEVVSLSFEDRQQMDISDYARDGEVLYLPAGKYLVYVGDEKHAITIQPQKTLEVDYAAWAPKFDED